MKFCIYFNPINSINIHFSPVHRTENVGSFKILKSFIILHISEKVKLTTITKQSPVEDQLHRDITTKV